jgi:hypothetical protein
MTTRTALAFCYHAEMIGADEVIGKQLTSGDGAVRANFVANGA